MIRVFQSSAGVEKGMRFGLREVIGSPFSIGTGQMQVVVRCDCGEVAAARCSLLKAGRSTGCAVCKNRLSSLKHGACLRGKSERIYSIYRGMIDRCSGAKKDNIKNYYGRGISVCAAWRESYEGFKAWALANGYSDELTIDRIDNDGNYEPENCRWVTLKENQRNRRDNYNLTAFGETKCLAAWLEDGRCSVPPWTIRKRIGRGWSAEQAISELER